MTLYAMLEAIEEFLKVNVAPNILLQKEGTDPPQYVHPAVAVCYTPHKNFSDSGFQIPYILVSFDDDEDNGQDDDATVRLVFATYGGGKYKDVDGNDVNIPDAQGYKDILNLMELAKQKLFTAAVIGGKTVVKKPVRRGMYDIEQTWPLWFGYMTFYASVATTDYLIESED